MNVKEAFENAKEHEPAETAAPLDPKAVACALANLSLLEYGLRREDEAKKLGITLAILDEVVDQYRKAEMAGAEADAPFTDPEPWHKPVDGAALLDEMVSTFKRFVVSPTHSPEALALWCLHAHAHDAAGISPILAVVSPEMRCGKTTLIKVISGLVPRPMHAVNISPPVLFRVVEKYKPTVLVDEGDSFLKDNDDLRGIINAGHDRHSAFVWRCVGDDHEPCRFDVWAPKAIAMIGRLPDTLEDRAIVVPLRRRRESETVDRFRTDQMHKLAPLNSKAVRWANDNLNSIVKHDPAMPANLNDRAKDNWHLLIAIADQAGGHWPKTAREAAVALSSEAAKGDDGMSAGVLLLRDIREVMGGWKSMKSSSLAAALQDIEDAPWQEWRGGKPITSSSIVRLLKPFKIRPHRGKGGSFYRVVDLQDAWDRYLDVSSSQPFENKCEPATCDQTATKKTLKFKAKSQVAGGCSSKQVAGGKCDDIAGLTSEEIKHGL